MTRVKVSALQLGASQKGKAATLAAILGFEAEITASGASLVVLPEALLGGYPKGQGFGTRVGYRLPEGRQDFADYHAQAIDVPGAEVEALAGLSARTGAHLVVGAIERAGGTLYCSALTFAPEQGLVAVRRKLMPTAAERLIWGLGGGADIVVADAGFATLGAAICWENYMPLLRVALYEQGVTIWCAPTVDDRDQWQSTMRHIALEGRCFVVSACQLLGSPADIGLEADGWDPAHPLIRGGSVIVSPLGDVLAGPLFDAPGLVTAEIDTGDIIRARYDFDCVGHYSRPDLFTLQVARTSTAGVRFHNAPSHGRSDSSD